MSAGLIVTGVWQSKADESCNVNLDRVHNTKIKQVNWFSYLGSLITSDGKCDREMKRRIEMST